MGGNAYAEKQEATLDEVVAALVASIKPDSNQLTADVMLSVLEGVKAAGFKIVK